MTDDERFSLIHGFMTLRLPGFGAPNRVCPPDLVSGAGYVCGIPRGGVPSLRETNASLGVTNPFGARKNDTATALLAGLAMGATSIRTSHIVAAISWRRKHGHAAST